MRKNKKAFQRAPALFSYRQGDSIVHLIPPLVKLILLCVICARTFSRSVYGGIFDKFCSENMILWIRTAFYFCIQAVLFFAARTPLASLKKLKFVFVIGAMLAALRLIPSGIDSAEYYKLNLNDLISSLLYIFRFFITSASALIIFETTSRLEIFDAFNSIEKKLALLFPAVKKLNIALTLSITISFIPEIFSTWKDINLAAAARNGQDKKSILCFFRITTAEFFALFYNMFEYAEQLRKASINRYK